MISNRKIRWGVLGCSRVAKKSALPALVQHGGSELVAVASRSVAKAQSYAQQFSCRDASYEEIVADPTIDAVYISLPNALHEEWVLRAAAAGKHIWCEKPCALTVASAQRMIQACSQANVRLFEGFSFLYHPQHDAVRTLIDKGTIGEVVGLHGRFAFPYPEAESSLLRADLGGGSLNDSAVYPLRIAQLLLGDPISLTAHLSFAGGTPVDTAAEALISFPSNITAHVSSSFGSYFESTYTVYGSKGRIRTERAYAVPADKSVNICIDTSDKTTEIEIPAADQFLRMIAVFCETILAESVERDHEHSLLMQAVLLDTIRRSSNEGRSITIEIPHDAKQTPLRSALSDRRE